MSKTVLFDLDDTLVDGDRIGDFVRKADLLKYYGISFSDEEFANVINMGFRETNSLIARAANIDPLEVLMHIGTVSSEYDRFLTLNSEAIYTLTRLNQYNIKVGIVTDRGPNSSKRLIENFGLEPLIGACVDGSSTANRKPSPDPILLAMAMLGSDPSKTLYVGNELKDYSAARSANVHSAMITPDFSFEGEFSSPILSLSEVIELMDAM